MDFITSGYTDSWSKRMKRTHASIMMRKGNFDSLDPSVQGSRIEPSREADRADMDRIRSRSKAGYLQKPVEPT